MKNGLFSRINNKIKSLNPREQWLFRIALVIALFLLIDRGIIEPINQYNEELAARTAEKVQFITDIRKYVSHKEWQKELFQGNASDFLAVLMQKAKESQFGPVRLKKTENSDKGIFVHFEGNGDVQKILDFIVKLEKLDFVVLFQKADIALTKGSEYHFDGEILVVKG